jgi:hypothetical protein
MMPPPVQLQIGQALTRARFHVLVRLILLIVLGSVGCSSLYWLLYLAIPALVAVAVSGRGGERYLAEDAPRLARALGWLASAYAYLWLLTDEAPGASGERAVQLHLELGPPPTARSALLRLVTSLPALILLALLSLLSAVLWVFGAIVILASERAPTSVLGFIERMLRYQFRLAAYHLSLVDRYPTFGEGVPTSIAHAA